MRPRPSWRFWLLASAAGVAEGALALVLFLQTRIWVGPVHLLAVVLVVSGLARERSLQAMTTQRRRGWALLGGLLALAISAALGLAAFVVALTIACENGC